MGCATKSNQPYATELPTAISRGGEPLLHIFAPIRVVPIGQQTCQYRSAARAGAISSIGARTAQAARMLVAAAVGWSVRHMGTRKWRPSDRRSHQLLHSRRG